MATVSASMIVRDEEAGLEAAIASLRRISAIDEVVVLDTGSTDGTPEIARDLGASVHHEPWQGDFSLHRNRCLELTKNDWVFILDGDEVVTDPGDLDAFFERPAGDAALVQVRCVRDGELLETFMAPRAFDKRRCRWRYPVHNQIEGIEEVTSTSAHIVAHYDETAEDTTRKRLEVLLEHSHRAPEDSHYPYFIAKAYRSLGEHERVLEWGDRYFDLAGPTPGGAVMCTWMIEAHLALGQQREAAELLELAGARYADFADIRYWKLCFAALSWYATVQRPSLGYLTVPARSQQHREAFPEAARLLGLPVRFGPRNGPGVPVGVADLTGGALAGGEDTASASRVSPLGPRMVGTSGVGVPSAGPMDSRHRTESRPSSTESEVDPQLPELALADGHERRR